MPRPTFPLILAFDLFVGLPWWLTFNVMPEPWSWLLLAGLHLMLPFFAARCSVSTSLWRGFLAGPGLVLGAYVILLIRYIGQIWDGHPEDTWLAWLMVVVYAAAIFIVALYSLLVTAYLQRRSLRC